MRKITTTIALTVWSVISFAQQDETVNGNLKVTGVSDLQSAHVGNWPGYTTNPDEFAYFGHSVLDSTGNNYAVLQSSVGATYFNSASGQNIKFRVDNEDKVIITKVGSVGIGTTSPGEKLHVQGTILADRFKLSPSGAGMVKDNQASNYTYLSPKHYSNNTSLRSGYNFGMDKNGNAKINSFSGSKIAFNHEGVLHSVMTSEGNLGLGNANPVEKLEVNGGVKLGATNNGSEGTIIYYNGRFQGLNSSGWVNLNIESTDNLQVNSIAFGNSSIGKGVNSGQVKIQNVGATSIHHAAVVVKGKQRDYQKIFQIEDESGRNMFFATQLANSGYSWSTHVGDMGLFWSDEGEVDAKNESAGFVIAPWRDGNGMRIGNDGLVMIGNLKENQVPVPVDSEYKFIVEGRIGATGIKCDLNKDWADFVFDDTYVLKPLEEVDGFIVANNHLPGIPSTEQLEETGVDVTEMLKLQMMKIEELTLYIIEQNKRIKELEKQK